ncbi:hypothetical protein ACFQZE_24000 [Paenibacillus sp. GCM10027627]
MPVTGFQLMAASTATSAASSSGSVRYCAAATRSLNGGCAPGTCRLPGFS